MLDSKLKESFTIGIVDDIKNSSLNVDESYKIDLKTTEVQIYGFGSDGMVSASKDIIHILGDEGKYVQSYNEYDSKKSGGVTIAHLRIGKNPINAPYYEQLKEDTKKLRKLRDQAYLVDAVSLDVPVGEDEDTFLSDFESVSINMAKNQMLALNPNKINGVCGRLKCCLKYENEIYKEKRKNMPKIGELIETNDGMGKVIDINILQRTAKVELQNKTVISMDFGE